MWWQHHHHGNEERERLKILNVSVRQSHPFCSLLSSSSMSFSFPRSILSISSSSGSEEKLDYRSTTHKKTNLHLNSSDGLIWQPSWWVWNIINSMRAKSVDGGNIYYPWIRDPGALLTYLFWSEDVFRFANVYQDLLFPFPDVYVNSLLMSIQPWW